MSEKPDDRKASPTDIMELTTGVVAAYVSKNTVAADDLSAFIHSVHGTLRSLGRCESEKEEKPRPAVSIKKSIKPDHLVCLEDGKKLKVLKRHLMTDHGMTPEQYREKWGLPYDYPMTSPQYAEFRSGLAKKIGLGTKRKRSGKTSKK
jgi:predicted transcriptional regulator